MKRGRAIAVIPAGEKWEDGSLRPCFEDLAGAGAVIRHLRGSLSPEASAALAVFDSSSSNIHMRIAESISGREKTDRGEAADVALASELNVSQCVPELIAGAYRKEI
jgi:2-phosphosulfolactate phosphatase